MLRVSGPRRLPRVCGGRGRPHPCTDVVRKSAPRSRGSRQRDLHDPGAPGVSPAYAGVYIDMRLTLPGLGQLPRAPTARGSGATGRGLGILHQGRGFVQYARTLASRSPPSWSGAARGRRPGLSRRRTTARRLRGNQKGPGRSQADGGEGTQPHDQDLTRPRGIEHVSSPVSTALTSGVPPSKRLSGIVGIPRLLPGSRRRCGVDVSAMDTSAPPDSVGTPPSAPAYLVGVRPRVR